MLLLALSLGRWGSALEVPLLRRTMLQIPQSATVSQNFLLRKTPSSTFLARFPFLFQAGLFSAAGPQTELAPWQGWPHPHSTQLQRQAPNNRFLGNLFVHTRTVNHRSTLQRAFALWEMPKYEVCVSLLGMRNKMHNPSNKVMLKTAKQNTENPRIYTALSAESDTLHSRSCTRPTHYS